MDTFRSMKTNTYTPRGATAPSSSRADLYTTPPPRSPIDAGRSKSRSRFGRDRDYNDRDREYNDRDRGDEHRNPLNEGRSGGGYGHSMSAYQGRSKSTMRDRDPHQSSRFEDEESEDRQSIGSSAKARDVLSKMRSGGRGLDRDRGGGGGILDRVGADRGMYTEPSNKAAMRRNIQPGTSPRVRRLDLHRPSHEEDDMMYGSNSGSLPHHHSSENHDMNMNPTSRYEVMGMKEELKKKDNATASLRREIEEMTVKHEENMTSVRSKLVSTFKEDMQEMKTEWEEAFQRLKDESDTTQRAMEMELNEVTRASADKEGELNELRVEFRNQMEEEKNRYKQEMEELAVRSKEQLGDLKTEYRTQMEELKRSKEEDLERLRAMYEEHLDNTKQSASTAESELKEEIHVLLEENEKVKMCYENLETEMSRCKNDLDELNSNYQKAINENLRYEKDTVAYKEELDDVLDENDKRSRRNKALEDELSDVKTELERMTSQCQRAQAEKTRFEKEYDASAKERDATAAEYDDLVKKLGGVQEERALESRYTEALVNQRDNMNAIIENGQAEIEELKAMTAELSDANRSYEGLGKEFRLSNGDASTLREELVKAEELDGLGKDFHLGNGEDLASAIREELVSSQQFTKVAKEFGLPTSSGDAASAMREELVKASSAARDEAAKSEKMNARLETLGRERERYNATVKALKYDLKALHGGNVGSETSLQEHMRLLNEKWDGHESRVKQVDKLKSELEESIQLLEENAKEREQMMKEHEDRTDTLERDLKETQLALVKVEREKIESEDRLADYDLMDGKKKRAFEDLEAKCEKLEDRLAYAEDERQDRESQCKSLESDKRSLNAELDTIRSKKSALEDALDNMDDVKKGMKKKLESAYFDLEQAQREKQSIKTDISKLSRQKDTIATQEEEIKSLKEKVSRSRREQSKDVEDAQAEVAESFKVQLRLLEEKHANEEHRNNEYLDQKHREEIKDLQAKTKHMERAMMEMERAVKEKENAGKELKESLDQKSMAEIKRRGEFAKQKQEMEILRSKERHLETHVNQLEEHISKVVADYEGKLSNSNMTTCSSVGVDEKRMKRQIRELEKKLEVSSAAMKQIGKSSLLMEKENERLKNDKNELKVKLKKLVDCAEKFSPK